MKNFNTHNERIWHTPKKVKNHFYINYRKKKSHGTLTMKEGCEFQGKPEFKSSQIITNISYGLKTQILLFIF